MRSLIPTGIPSSGLSALPAAGARFVGGLARALEVEEREGHDGRLKRLDAFNAALEVSPRRVCAVGETPHGIVEAQHTVRRRIVTGRGRLHVCDLHQEMWV